MCLKLESITFCFPFYELNIVNLMLVLSFFSLKSLILLIVVGNFTIETIYNCFWLFTFEKMSNLDIFSLELNQEFHC
jgi:hypothetical protein